MYLGALIPRLSMVWIYSFGVFNLEVFAKGLITFRSWLTWEPAFTFCFTCGVAFLKKSRGYPHSWVHFPWGSSILLSWFYVVWSSSVEKLDLEEFIKRLLPSSSLLPWDPLLFFTSFFRIVFLNLSRGYHPYRVWVPWYSFVFLSF